MFDFQLYLDDDISLTCKKCSAYQRRPERWILWGIPGIILISFAFAFSSRFASERLLIAITVPVNESIWEHMKLTLYPVALWWILYFFVKYERYKISARKWFTAGIVALLISLNAVPVIYYAYTESLGIYSEIINIGILFVAVISAQLFGLYIYRRTTGWHLSIPIFIFFIVIICFSYFTFSPPHLPIFMDSTTGEYGISFSKLDF